MQSINNLLGCLVKQQPPAGGILFDQALFACQLDSSLDSLKNLDRLVYKVKQQVSLQEILSTTKGENFIKLLSVYLGSYIEYHTKNHANSIVWLDSYKILELAQTKNDSALWFTSIKLKVDNHAFLPTNLIQDYFQNDDPDFTLSKEILNFIHIIEQQKDKKYDGFSDELGLNNPTNVVSSSTSVKSQDESCSDPILGTATNQQIEQKQDKPDVALLLQTINKQRDTLTQKFDKKTTFIPSFLKIGKKSADSETISDKGEVQNKPDPSARDKKNTAKAVKKLVIKPSAIEPDKSTLTQTEQHEQTQETTSDKSTQKENTNQPDSKGSMLQALATLKQDIDYPSYSPDDHYVSREDFLKQDYDTHLHVSAKKNLLKALAIMQDLDCLKVPSATKATKSETKKDNLKNNGMISAIELIEEAAHQGHGGAQFFLSETYETGLFTETSEEKHSFWLDAALRSKHPKAIAQKSATLQRELPRKRQPDSWLNLDDGFVKLIIMALAFAVGLLLFL